MMRAYDALAGVYDSLNGEVDYSAIADFAVSLFDRYHIRPELVLDLGCGTGALTLEMAKHGYDMIGIDASNAMLSLAYERKMREGRPDVLFLQQDMRSFELYGTVGAVVSSLDCFNYLTGEGDLVRCLSLVHNYLEPNGIIVFDVNSPYKFERVFGNEAYILENESAYCGWQNQYDRETKCCTFYLSVFEEDEDGRYIRRDEEQVERCYDEGELRDALVRTGFSDICFFGDLKGNPPTENSERWYVAARCKK